LPLNLKTVYFSKGELLITIRSVVDEKA